MDFSVYEHNSSEESGETSRARNHLTFDTRARASPIASRQNHPPNQILKSKSGHSIKGFEL